MRPLLLGIVLCAPLIVFAQDPNLSPDTTFPGDKPAAKTDKLPEAPAPAKTSSSNMPDAPTPSSTPAPPKKPVPPPAAESSAPPASAPLPRSTGESSSKDNPVDISPPPGDDKHPGADLPSEIDELRPWNPHQADKEVEVGEFYYKRGNYIAAESRFQGALHWQWNHAEATFHLAQTEEKLNKPEEARKYYSMYLSILPEGPEAQKTKKALDKLGGPVPVTAQNREASGGGPADAPESLDAQKKAYRGIKEKLKDLSPQCVELGGSPCYNVPRKDPASDSSSASKKAPPDSGTTSQPSETPQ
ncbi:MAG TPA: hypothetical protein VKW78_12815 [Terriglobales bacterium]|nr:hypothetical protein [Terriglobales bacterium]